jgi:flagellar biosynthesis protein FliR
MAEVALALLGRVNSQLHISSHSFPLKILITLLVLGSVLLVAPDLYSSYADAVFRTIRGSILR